MFRKSSVVCGMGDEVLSRSDSVPMAGSWVSVETISYFVPQNCVFLLIKLATTSLSVSHGKLFRSTKPPTGLISFRLTLN